MIKKGPFLYVLYVKLLKRYVRIMPAATVNDNTAQKK